jgi:hypothetical protein
MILKQVIKYDNANGIEATWVVRVQLPDVEVPETPAVLDEKGEVVTPAVPAHTEPGGVQETVVKCQSYADVQMQMFRDDVAEFGGDISEYKDLIAEVEAGIVPPPPPTSEEITAEIMACTQERLDSFARTQGYNSILSACTYATSTVPQFKSDGQYCVNARDQTWGKLYDLMAQVKAGKRPMPSGYAAIEAELPPLKWPTA